MEIKKIIKRLLLILISIYLNGCYSTEVVSSKTLNDVVNYQNCIKYPIALIPADREVIPGQIVNLKVSIHPNVCPDEVIGFEWFQISGPSVHLTNNSSDNTSFIVPPEYEDIILKVRIKGREHNYEDSIVLKIVDKIANFAPYADADGDIILPINYKYKISANYSQGINRTNMKYLWTTVPDSNPGLSIDSNDSIDTTIAINYESVIPHILLLEVIEKGLRSTKNIKLIYTNLESKSVIIPQRFQPSHSEIYAPTNSTVELIIKDIEYYEPKEIFWYQLSGEFVDLKKTSRGSIIKTSEYIDDLVFAAYVKIDNLFSPPVLFRVSTGKTIGLDPPIADAGPDQKVKAFSEVRLNGSKSSVSFPRKIKYKWKQVYGTSVILRDSETAFPSFTAPRIFGKLVFLLTVSDGYATSRPDTVVIEVSN